MKQNSAHTQKKQSSAAQKQKQITIESTSGTPLNFAIAYTLSLDSCIHFNKRDGTSLTVFMGES